LPPTDGRAQERVGEVFRRVNPSVVIIRARWKEVSGRVSEVGSGFLVSADGKIITAAHVVQTADDITAEFLGGETIPAKVVASEPEADVALLELERPPAQPILARMGDSDTVQVGVASHNISRSGGFEGLGFVVTINLAKRILLEGGRSGAGWPGSWSRATSPRRSMCRSPTGSSSSRWRQTHRPP
jgi:S1-C subfamily serine protease